MNDPTTMMVAASFTLVALALALMAGLKGWQGWLDLKRLELGGARGQGQIGGAMERIEVADLRERIRKLEAIAACVDL